MTGQPGPYPELVTLLATFPRAEGYLEFRGRDPVHHRITRLFARPDDLARALAWLARRGGFTDAFMGIALRDGHGGGKANVVSLPALWVDLDRSRLELPEDVPGPTAIVSSGRGHHLYWALATAIALDEDRRRYVDGVLRGLARRLGGDVASAEVAHLLRVPGTLNAKYRPPVPARLIHLVPDRRLPFARFAAYAAAVESTTSPPASWRSTPVPLRPPPTDAVARLFAGCAFLRWAHDHQADVSEPLWHAALTNLGPFSGGLAAARALSEQYPRFNPSEFHRKFEHARNRCRPHTCQRIHALGFADCLGCPRWGRVKAPAVLAYRCAVSRLPPRLNDAGSRCVRQT
jgi:hypothetical protein